VKAGVDVACGVYTDTHLQIELSEYELQRISDFGIPYTILIEDVTKYYSERAARDMPRAQLRKEKLESLANKSSSVKSVVIGNIGQRDDCSGSMEHTCKFSSSYNIWRMLNLHWCGS
jgi:hypothetical protein